MPTSHQINLTILKELCTAMKKRIMTEEELLSTIYTGFQEGFGFSGITIHIFKPKTNLPLHHFPKNGWPIPTLEMKWLIQEVKKSVTSNPFCYIDDRENFHYTDKNQLKRDKLNNSLPCNDILYCTLKSEDIGIIGIIALNNWESSEHIWQIKEFELPLVSWIQECETALDNLFIHKRIESLLSDKKELKKRIQEDEEALKRRILELTVLYDTSNSLGGSLDKNHITSITMESLMKVLQLEICNIFLLEFSQNGEIISNIDYPLNEEDITKIQNGVISSIMPFTSKPINVDTISFTTNKRFNPKLTVQTPTALKSLANVPLIFKDDVIGILTVGSIAKNSFARNEMTFLHTMANQLASHLGRVKMVKEAERSKINSLIQSMQESIIMINLDDSIEIINPSAKTLFNLDDTMIENATLIPQLLKNIKVATLYNQVKKTKETISNIEIPYKNQILSVTISPVINSDAITVGTVIVLRDTTEIEKANRTKVQRLEIITKVDNIINSISDLDNLLEVLMEFIMTIAGADMGSIQLKEASTGQFYTQVHSNFPDKIRIQYQFTNQVSISEHVSISETMHHIPNYSDNTNMIQQTKIKIKSYLCIPILAKNKLIGILNLVQKADNSHSELSSDDLNTLISITSLMGTSIQNALLYQEKLKQQNLEQELAVAHKIQVDLLPSETPKHENYQISAISKPAREIGGDYFDFFEISPTHIGILIADIVGKGIPAGLFMAALKSTLYSHIFRFESPKKAMSFLNELLAKDPVITKFIPIFYGILNTETNTFTYTNAGHEPGLFISNNQCKLLDTEGFPLGGMEDTVFEEKKINLNPNDIIFLFTDGIIESKNKRGAIFGLDRLKQLLKKNMGLKPDQIIREITESAKEFSHLNQMEDDMTMVCIKHSKTKQKKSTESAILHQSEIEVTSAKTDVKKVRQYIEDMCKKNKIKKSIVFDIKLAVDEAQSNIIEHVYFGKTDGKIILTTKIYQDRLEISLVDFGHSVHQKTIKNKKHHLKELEGSGLGVFLINTLMDKVIRKEIPNVGNELILIKKLK
jgi:serine phosphatase RsbU (regulator of sigma subunit)/anti-sigma regulatory factor (Ser/Thr protein kinase)